MPELYLLIVILLPEDFIHHEDLEGHEERTKEGASNLKGAFFLRVLRGRIHFSKTLSCTSDLEAADLAIILFSAFVERDYTFGAQVLRRDRDLKALQMLGLILIRRGDGIPLIGTHSRQQIRKFFGQIFAASQQPSAVVNSNPTKNDGLKT